MVGFGVGGRVAIHVRVGIDAWCKACSSVGTWGSSFYYRIWAYVGVNRAHITNS